MDDHSDSRSIPGVDEIERRGLKHRIYRYRVTWVIILLCSLIFLGGIWIGGGDLEGLVWQAGMFEAGKHTCLRTAWLNTTQGEADRVQLCTEWIDPSDLSGRTHKIAIENVEIIKGPDGKIRTHLQRGINYRLVAAIGYLLIIILGGRWIQHFLIHRHKQQMGLT